MLGNRSIKGLPLWIKRELLVYSHAMVHLAGKYGKQMPDTELVISSDDVPGLPAFREAARPPVFRWARALAPPLAAPVCAAGGGGVPRLQRPLGAGRLHWRLSRALVAAGCAARTTTRTSSSPSGTCECLPSGSARQQHAEGPPGARCRVQAALCSADYISAVPARLPFDQVRVQLLRAVPGHHLGEGPALPVGAEKGGPLLQPRRLSQVCSCVCLARSQMPQLDSPSWRQSQPAFEACQGRSAS
jgi:hypothetical protein